MEGLTDTIIHLIILIHEIFCTSSKDSDTVSETWIMTSWHWRKGTEQIKVCCFKICFLEIIYLSFDFVKINQLSVYWFCVQQTKLHQNPFYKKGRDQKGNYKWWLYFDIRNSIPSNSLAQNSISNLNPFLN